VALDAAAVGAPISPYIYGMFIEHQGRCIYGGIWAEMIEDRKFFYPVNYYFSYGNDKAKSPWRAIPYDTAVTMERNHAYVGEHSPRIALDGQKPRGMMQERLALRRGKDYVGRIVLAGSGSATVVVSLVWGANPNDRQTIAIGQLAQKYATTQLKFTAGADADNGRLEIVGQGEGNFYVGAVSLMPAANVHGMRADTLQLLKELGGTVYRWPGGLFANGYNWRIAIGERDRRPPTLNRAYWSEDVESNDFGPDEFMALVQALGAEPYVAVGAMNTPDVQMAAEEVQYFNGAPDTPMGRLRAANGHPQPYGVRFWGVGNENWGFAALDEYPELNNQMATAMRAVDPTITIIAVGGIGNGGQGKPAKPGEPDWTQVMLTRSADYMDLISEHDYGPPNDDVVEHSRAIAQGVRIFTDAHRRYRRQLPSLQGKDIRLALDEWNYFWGDQPQIYGEAGPRYRFKNALGIASALHEMFRNSDLVFMANTHPVNVHGHVKTTQTDAAFEVTALPLIVYRHYFGTLPLTINGDTRPLDVAAAWTTDHQSLTVAVVNPTPQSYALTLDLKNARLIGEGRWWRIASPDPLAYNEPGQPPRVGIEEGSQSNISSVLDVPPLSIILYKLPAQPGQMTAQPGPPTGRPGLYKFIRTVTVTPDSNFQTGSFARINYVPATDRFVVTFGTKASLQSGDCKGAGYAYKEYTTDMQETGKSGRLVWTPNACEAGDSGSVMAENIYYFVSLPQAPGQPYGWQLTKFDAVGWKTLAEAYVSLKAPNEGDTDPTVAYVNGQLDVNAQYNPSGKWQDGAATHHHFFSTALQPLGEKILADTRNICGSSMIYVDGVYYIVTANAHPGDLIVMKYDKDWKYLGMKELRKQAHWSTGLVFDGQRFYVAYLDTSQRTNPGLFPVYLNVRLAAFDRNWNLVDDVAVTNFTPSDNKQAGRPWVILHGNRLYVSYDVDTINPATHEEQLRWEANVSIYEL